MGEDRFDKIDGRLDTIDGRLNGIDGRLDTVDGRLNGIDGRLDTIDGRLNGIDGRLDKVDERFVQVDARFEEIRTQMGVLHEDAIGRTAALFEEPLATRAEMNRGFAQLAQLISERTAPLERVVRALVERQHGGA